MDQISVGSGTFRARSDPIVSILFLVPITVPTRIQPVRYKKLYRYLWYSLGNFRLKSGQFVVNEIHILLRKSLLHPNCHYCAGLVFWCWVKAGYGAGSAE